MKYIFVLALLMVTVAGLNTPAEEIQHQGEKASVSVRYLDELEENLRRLREDVPKFIESAEAIAKNYVEDDKYILGAGGDSGFVTEAVGRSGGLMELIRVRRTNLHGAVIYCLREALLDEDIKLLSEMKKNGVTTVVFGRKALLEQIAKAGHQADFTIDNRAPARGGFIRLDDGSYAIPTDHPANTAALWIWTGEFIAANTRLGKMPVVYQGYAVEGGRERARRLRGKKFHEETVDAMPPGKAGRDYIDRVIENLERVRERELGNIRAVAQAASEAMRNGRKLYIFPHNHILLDRSGCYRDPNYFVRISRGWFKQRRDIRVMPGDFIFCIGFTRTYESREWGSFVERTRRRGGLIAWSLTDQYPEQIAALPERELVIRQHWHYSDAVVEVPGYEIKIVPGSGVVSEAIMWMVNAELHELLEEQREAVK